MKVICINTKPFSVELASCVLRFDIEDTRIKEGKIYTVIHTVSVPIKHKGEVIMEMTGYHLKELQGQVYNAARFKRVDEEFIEEIIKQVKPEIVQL